WLDAARPPGDRPRQPASCLRLGCRYGRRRDFPATDNRGLAVLADPRTASGGDRAGGPSTRDARRLGAAGAAPRRGVRRGRLYRSMEDGFGVGWANHMLGTLYITIGEPQKGEPYLREGLLTFAASRDLSGILLLLLDFAILAGAHADEERQWRLAGAANEIQVSTGTDLVDVPIGEFSWEVPKPPTGDERAERLYRDGQGMAVEGASAYALGDPSS